MVTVYLDLDGVCADFLTQSLSYFNTTPEQLYSPPQAKGVWEVEGLLGVTLDQFWATLPDDIFACLPVLEDGMNVYRYLLSKNLPVKVCTSPNNNPRSYMDKAAWVKKYMPDAWEQGVCIYRNKWELAKRDKLLIDDSDKNCKRFLECGGNAILFPRPWNSNWELSDNSVMYVLTEINKQISLLDSLI